MELKTFNKAIWGIVTSGAYKSTDYGFSFTRTGLDKALSDAIELAFAYAVEKYVPEREQNDVNHSCKR